MLGFMALVMAFGLSLAVGRYESRRAAVVTEANALGTAYLRPRPDRAEPDAVAAVDAQFTDASIDISETVPGSPEQQAALASSSDAQRALWDQAGQAVTAQPAASAPRLYLDSLDEASTPSRPV